LFAFPCPIGWQLSPTLVPIILHLNPNGPVHSRQRTASDALEGAFGSFSESPPKDLYVSRTTPLETSTESRDASKRKMAWKETVKHANLKEGESILSNWQ
jgi:hypothetical protein